MSAPTPKEYIEMNNIDSMMELWISRDAVQTVVQAASQRLSELVFSDAVCRLENALKLVHEAVKDAWEDPLDVTPL